MAKKKKVPGEILPESKVKKQSCCSPIRASESGPPIEGVVAKLPDCPEGAGKYRLICERTIDGCKTFWELL